MNTTKAIVSIHQLFALLEQHGSILGRTKTQIVLDRLAMPSVVDWKVFSSYNLEFEDGKAFAKRSIFSGISMNACLVIVDISDIEKDRHTHEYFKGELTELAELFAHIPQVSEDRLIAAADCEAGASAMLAERGPEILQALLSGGIKPVKDETRH